MFLIKLEFGPRGGKVPAVLFKELGKMYGSKSTVLSV